MLRSACVWKPNGARPAADIRASLSAEQRAMQRAFAHFDRLGLIGGCIYVGDKLVAFTYGSPINDHTFCVHVEKADTEYDGAFTIINREFVAHLPEQYTLIDREEDLGIRDYGRPKALLPSGIPREEIYGPLPLPRRNSLQTALDKVLRRRRNLHRLLPDRPLQPQADARSRRGRPSGGHAAPDPVRKRAWGARPTSTAWRPTPTTGAGAWPPD